MAGHPDLLRKRKTRHLRRVQIKYHAESAMLGSEKIGPISDSVGAPYRNDNGERICRIESLHADDRTVFLLAFGSDVANQIEHSKPGITMRRDECVVRKFRTE